MPFKEKKIGVGVSILLLVLAFLLLYSPWQIGDRELYWSEGLYAVIAQDCSFSDLLTTAHGVLVPNNFPLFPRLVSLLHSSTLPMEHSLRFLSVLCTLILGIIVWETTRRAANVQCAAAAVAMFISSNIVIEKTLDGYPNTMAILFLTTAHLCWFYFGVVRGNWNLGWIIAFFFCSLSFYTIGWAAVIYFILPLVFMRRPLTVWPKLRRSGFFIGLGVLLCFISLWGVPRWVAGSDIPFAQLPIRSLFDWEYLLTLPFDVVLRFMPWSLIAWAPFCVALFAFESNPIFSRFLRTLFFSLFFALWLLPGNDARDMLVLAPSLAMLTGMTYPIVVRRYGARYNLALNCFSYIALLGALSIAVFYLLPIDFWTSLFSFKRSLAFHDVMRYRVIGFCLSAVALSCSLLLMFRIKKLPLWFSMLLSCVCAFTMFWAFIHPYRAQENEKRAMGCKISVALAKDGGTCPVLYKYNISGLYGECFYLGVPVRKINALDQLDKSMSTVYLISIDFPQATEYDWTNLFPADMTYRDKRICLWKGELFAKKKKSDGKELP